MEPSQQEIVDDIFRRHLMHAEVETVRASDVAIYQSSPFALYCEFHAPEDQRDPDSESLAMRRGRGYEYEAELMEDEVLFIPSFNLKEMFRLTVEMMAAGVPIIYQGLLISKPIGMVGKPDQIVKVRNSKSIFGNYRYRIVEVKSQFNLTDSHKIQAAFYNRLLGEIQGLTPKEFTLINGRRTESLERFNWWEGRLNRSIEIVRQIIAGQHTPQPVFGATPWPWRSFGDKMAGSDLTRLWQIGYPRKEALVSAGYCTIEDIAQASERDLSVVPKLDPYVAGLIVPQAKAILKKTPVPRKPVRFPKTDVEIFIDMENLNEGHGFLEGTDFGFVNYLIGVVVRSESDERYVAFFAEELGEEAKCWNEFCEFVASVQPSAIYYWSVSAERVYIRKMVAKYQTPPEVQELLHNSIDLQRVTTDSFAFPAESYGLKDIAGYLGFDWRLTDYDGWWAGEQYKRYLRSKDPAIRDKLLKYNEDDCQAAVLVKDWLVANSL